MAHFKFILADFIHFYRKYSTHSILFQIVEMKSNNNLIHAPKVTFSKVIDT